MRASRIATSTISARSNILVLGFFFGLFLAPRPARSQTVECPPGCSPGRWSSEAIDLSVARVKAPEEARDIRIASPDRSKSIRVVNERWWVESSGHKIFAQSSAATIFYPTEVAWSPDSSAFYITDSVGYTTGYHIAVYRIAGTRLREIKDIHRKVQRDFAKRHGCELGHLPNVAGLHWEDAGHLLVVGDEPNVGVCDEMNYFGGYMISLPDGKILARYSPQMLENQWKRALGYWLDEAFLDLPEKQKATLP